MAEAPPLDAERPNSVFSQSLCCAQGPAVRTGKPFDDQPEHLPANVGVDSLDEADH